jgi:dTDP-glucose 4,6-dehydratase
MRVVVTGGAGFIGVVQSTDRVLNVDKLTYAANLSSLAKMACKASYQFAQADIGARKYWSDLPSGRQTRFVS